MDSSTTSSWVSTNLTRAFIKILYHSLWIVRCRLRHGKLEKVKPLLPQLLIAASGALKEGVWQAACDR